MICEKKNPLAYSETIIFGLLVKNIRKREQFGFFPFAFTKLAKICCFFFGSSDYRKMESAQMQSFVNRKTNGYVNCDTLCCSHGIFAWFLTEFIIVV